MQVIIKTNLKTTTQTFIKNAIIPIRAIRQEEPIIRKQNKVIKEFQNDRKIGKLKTGNPEEKANKYQQEREKNKNRKKYKKKSMFY
jgi:hypothetical protein